MLKTTTCKTKAEISLTSRDGVLETVVTAHPVLDLELDLGRQVIGLGLEGCGLDSANISAGFWRHLVH